PSRVGLDADDPSFTQSVRDALRLHGPSQQCRAQLKIGPGQGRLRVTIRQDSPEQVLLDAYALGYDRSGRINSRFVNPKPSLDKLVGDPGTTPNAVTVGSYDWNPVVNGEPRQVQVSREGDVWRQMRVGALSA